MWYHVYLVAIDIAFYVITYRLLQMQQHVFSGLVVYKLELEYIPRAKLLLTLYSFIITIIIIASLYTRL